MALSQQEMEIVNYGKANGKSQDETLQAIQNYRKNQTTQPTPDTGGSSTTPSFGSRVTKDITEAGKTVNDQITGQGEFAGQSPVRRGIGAVATGFNTVLKVAFEALPENDQVKFRSGLESGARALGDKVGQLVNKISDNKALQQFMKDVPEKNLGEEILGSLGDLGQIAGDILTIDQATQLANKTASAIKSKFVSKTPATVPEGEISIDKIKDAQGDPLADVRNQATVTKHGLEMSNNAQGLDEKAFHGARLNRPVTEPIEVQLNPDNSYSVIDGNHRLRQAIMNGQTTIPATVRDTTGNIVKTTTINAEEATGSTAGKLPTSKGIPSEQLKLNTAISDATPNYELSTGAERQKLLPRVKEGGILKGRTVTPTALEKEAGEALSKVPGYEPDSTKLSKYQVTREDIARRATALETSLGEQKVIVPKKELSSIVTSAVNNVPENSLLLQKSDPVIKNYIRVLNNGLKEVDGTLKGELDLRKLLDDAYENARGKNAFGSDKVAALDEIHKAARDSITQDLIARAKNVDVKKALRDQWNLYRAMDQLQVAAEKEAGSSLGRIMQKFPLTSKVVETGLRAAGAGRVINIVK